jgi:hypothetical protein
MKSSVQDMVGHVEMSSKWLTGNLLDCVQLI